MAGDPRHGLVLSGDQLTELQRLGAECVTFSVTTACPLRCDHCPVGDARAETGQTMTLAQAHRYADGIPELVRRGVREISFTGGEPLLAREQIRILSGAAAAAGLCSSLVTACQWAPSEPVAAAVIAALPHVTSWQLSTDVHHLKFVPLRNVVRAATVAADAGREVTVRLAIGTPPTDEDRAIHRQLRAELPSVVRLAVQHIRTHGAQENGSDPEGARGACTATMVVHHDGAVGACCAIARYGADAAPFCYPNAMTEGLAAARDAWLGDSLLHLIRAVGFGPVLGWVAELAPEHSILQQVPRDGCDCCTRLFADGSLARELRRRADLPANRAKVKALLEQTLGETLGPGPGSAAPDEPTTGVRP